MSVPGCLPGDIRVRWGPCQILKEFLAAPVWAGLAVFQPPIVQLIELGPLHVAQQAVGLLGPNDVGGALVVAAGDLALGLGWRGLVVPGGGRFDSAARALDQVGVLLEAGLEVVIERG